MFGRTHWVARRPAGAGVRFGTAGALPGRRHTSRLDPVAQRPREREMMSIVNRTRSAATPERAASRTAQRRGGRDDHDVTSA
jgi:hypothetical protein